MTGPLAVTPVGGRRRELVRPRTFPMTIIARDPTITVPSARGKPRILRAGSRVVRFGHANIRCGGAIMRCGADGLVVHRSHLRCEQPAAAWQAREELVRLSTKEAATASIVEGREARTARLQLVSPMRVNDPRLGRMRGEPI